MGKLWMVYRCRLCGEEFRVDSQDGGVMYRQYVKAGVRVPHRDTTMMLHEWHYCDGEEGHRAGLGDMLGIVEENGKDDE